MTVPSDEDPPPRPPLPRTPPSWEERTDTPTAAVWAERADLAEAAIVSRHLRMLWTLPIASLGVVGWPPTLREQAFAPWHYWWQAHLLDCAVDAVDREPTPARIRRIASITRGHRFRNITGWTNNFYDDMAWLALALERAERTGHVPEARVGLIALEKELITGFDSVVGAISWRKGSDYYNAPANGPTGIALARLGHLVTAAEIADWLDENLRDPATDLVLDGVHLPGGTLERNLFSYCQGVVLGLNTELAVHTGEARYTERVRRLMRAVERHLTAGGVVQGGGGGDGGLFNGILARYLARVAVMLPGNEPAQITARRAAAAIVQTSARSAWENRLEVEGEPLFGRDWTAAAVMPTGKFGGGSFSGGSVIPSRNPERDLSVQLSGWMLMEAAYLVTAAGF